MLRGCRACRRNSADPDISHIFCLASFILKKKLEYLAVYGRASMGDYYGCAFRVLAVIRQLSTHGLKFYPESLYEPI